MSGKTNKRKGSNAERYYSEIFRNLGFSFCKTARFASKLHDDSKVDLYGIPINIQIKAGQQLGLNPGKELLLMQKCIKDNFPKNELIHTYPCILIHFKQVGKGRKRTNNDEYVYMSYKQFLLFKKQNKNIEPIEIKKNKLTRTQFNKIVSMTFEYFVNEIVNKIINVNDSK